jgi:uncharacterized FlaG/YvyC family protein
MSDSVNPVVQNMPVNGVDWSKSVSAKQSDYVKSDKQTESVAEPTAAELVDAASSLENIVNSVSDTALSFSVDQDISRMVVAVRAVGSDEIIRQFPPEEFITVAKFIAAQNPEMMSDDFLKGILFDQYT